MVIENYIHMTDFKDISKSVCFSWKKNFKISMWLAPLMIPISYLLHIYINLYDFSLIFILITILIYGEKYILESAYYKKHRRLLISNFGKEDLHYTVTFSEKEIIVNYNQTVQGHEEGKISYKDIKRVIESQCYYNIIGEKGYLLPIDKRNLSYESKKELLNILELKKVHIYLKKGGY